MEEYQSVDPGANSAIMAMMGTIIMVSLVFGVFMIVCYWKIFVKAGRPGWAAIIPIYSAIVLLEIVGKPWWWILLIMFLPIVNIVILIIVIHNLSVSFGQGVGMTLLLIFLPFIGLPMLAFGSAQYTGQKPLSTQPI